MIIIFDRSNEYGKVARTKQNFKIQQKGHDEAMNEGKCCCVCASVNCVCVCVPVCVCVCVPVCVCVCVSFPGELLPARETPRSLEAVGKSLS